MGGLDRDATLEARGKSVFDTVLGAIFGRRFSRIVRSQAGSIDAGRARTIG